MEGERWVDWPALLNARDLGGWPAGNYKTRSGTIVRADSLARLTHDGVVAMQGYGVCTAIDLRSPGERARWPSPVESRSGRARPLFDDATLAVWEERFEDDGGGYVWAVESRPREVATILQEIADAAPGGVVIYCGAGKDRTGIVAALLLGLVGVERDAILADFMLTADRVSQLANEEPDPSRRRLYRPEPELMTEMLNWLDDRHGGVAGYLRAAGVNNATQDRIRHRLTSA